MAAKSNETAAESKRPEAVFRIGFVNASVFVREVDTAGEQRKFRSVSLQKSYLDGNERKWNSSFSLAEIPQAIRCLQLAQQHVERQEAQSNSSD